MKVKSIAKGVVRSIYGRDAHLVSPSLRASYFNWNFHKFTEYLITFLDCLTRPGFYLACLGSELTPLSLGFDYIFLSD